MRALTRPGNIPSRVRRGRRQVIDGTEAWLLRRYWRFGEFLTWGGEVEAAERILDLLGDASAEQIVGAAQHDEVGQSAGKSGNWFNSSAAVGERRANSVPPAAGLHRSGGTR